MSVETRKKLRQSKIKGRVSSIQTKNMKQLAIDALVFQYKAQKKHAEHVLENYLNNPIGVGEHPDLIKEMDTALEKWEDANGKLETLLRLTGDTSGIG